MAKRPTKTKPKGRATPAAAVEPGPVAAQNVILEQMQGQMNVVIEAVTMTRESLERKIGELDHRLSSRMDTLEFALRKNNADLQTLTVKVDKLDAKLDTKTDTDRTAALEGRVEALEFPVG